MSTHEDDNVYMISSSSDSAEDHTSFSKSGYCFDDEGKISATEDDDIVFQPTTEEDDVLFRPTAEEDDVVFQPTASSGLSRSQEPRKYDGPTCSASRVRTLLKFPQPTAEKKDTQSREHLPCLISSSDEDLRLISDSNREVDICTEDDDIPVKTTSKAKSSDDEIYDWDTEQEIVHYSDEDSDTCTANSVHHDQKHSRVDNESCPQQNAEKRASDLFQGARRRSSSATNHSIYSINSASDYEKVDSASLFTDDDDDDAEVDLRNASTSSFSPILPSKSSRLSLSRKRKLDDSSKSELSIIGEPNTLCRAAQDLQKIDPRLSSAVVVLSPMQVPGGLVSSDTNKGHVKKQLHKGTHSSDNIVSDDFGILPLNQTVSLDGRLSHNHNRPKKQSSRHDRSFTFHTNSDSDPESDFHCLAESARKKQRLESSDSEIEEAPVSGVEHADINIGEEEFLTFSGSKRKLPATSESMPGNSGSSFSEIDNEQQVPIKEERQNPNWNIFHEDQMSSGVNKMITDRRSALCSQDICQTIQENDSSTPSTTQSSSSLQRKTESSSHQAKAVTSNSGTSKCSEERGEKATHLTTNIGGLKLGEEYHLDDSLCASLACDDWMGEDEQDENQPIIEVVSREQYESRAAPDDIKANQVDNVSGKEVSPTGNTEWTEQTLVPLDSKPDLNQTEATTSTSRRISVECSDHPRSTIPVDSMEYSQCYSPSHDDIILLSDEDDDTFFGELTQSVIKVESEEDAVQHLDDEDWNEEDIKAIDAQCQLHYEEMEKTLFAEGDDVLLQATEDFETTQKQLPVTDEIITKESKVDNVIRKDDNMLKDVADTPSGQAKGGRQLRIVLHDIQKSTKSKETLDVTEGTLPTTNNISSTDSGFKEDSTLNNKSKCSHIVSQILSSSDDEDEEPIPSTSRKTMFEKIDLHHKDFDTDDEDWVEQVEDPIPSRKEQPPEQVAIDWRPHVDKCSTPDSGPSGVQKARPDRLKLFPSTEEESAVDDHELEMSTPAPKSVGLKQQASSVGDSHLSSNELSTQLKKIRPRFGPSKHLKIRMDQPTDSTAKSEDKPVTSLVEKANSFKYLKSDFRHKSSSSDCSFELPELSNISKCSFYGKRAPPAWDTVRHDKEAEVSVLFSETWQKVGHKRTRHKSHGKIRLQSPIGLTQGIAQAMDKMKKRGKAAQKQADEELPDFDVPSLPELDNVPPQNNSLFIGESLTGKAAKRVAHVKPLPATKTPATVENKLSSVSADKVTIGKPRPEKLTVNHKSHDGDAKVQHTAELLKARIGTIDADAVKDAYAAAKQKKSLENKEKKTEECVKTTLEQNSKNPSGKCSNEALKDVVKKLRKRWHSEDSKFPKIASAEHLRKRPRRDSTSTVESRIRTPKRVKVDPTSRKTSRHVHPQKSNDTSEKKDSKAADSKSRPLDGDKSKKGTEKERSTKCLGNVENLHSDVLRTAGSSKQTERKKNRHDLAVKEQQRESKGLSSRMINKPQDEDERIAKSDDPLKKLSRHVVSDKNKLKPTVKVTDVVKRSRKDSTGGESGISKDARRHERESKVAAKSGSISKHESSEATNVKTSKERGDCKSTTRRDKSAKSQEEKDRPVQKAEVSNHTRREHQVATDKHKMKHKDEAIRKGGMTEVRSEKARHAIDRGYNSLANKEQATSEKSSSIQTQPGAFENTTNAQPVVPSSGLGSHTANEQSKRADIYSILNLKSPPHSKVPDGQPEPRRDRRQMAPAELQKHANNWSVDGVLRRMLMWSPNWFSEFQKVRQTPPVIGKDPLLPLLDTYESYDDYMKIMTAHFLLETWFHTYNGWKERVAQNKIQSHSLYPVHLNLNITEGFTSKQQERVFMDLACQGIFSHVEMARGLPVMEGDLVKVDLRYRDQANQLQVKVVVGYVQRSFKLGKGNHNMHRVIGDKLKTTTGNNTVLHVEVRLLFRKIRICNTEYFTISVFDNITHDIRQYSALAYLPKSMLSWDILAPRNLGVFVGPLVPEDPSLLQRYNSSQASVINMVSAGILQAQREPKMYLLQGPPGTGKSHVITGLIERVIRQGANIKPSPRILLCAPSNAAVDELARRLKKLRPSLQKYGLNFVRFGKQTSIHKDVAEFSLDALYDQQWQKYHASDRMELPSVRNALTQIENKLKGFCMARDNLQKANKVAEANHLEPEIEKLEKKKASIGGLSDKRQLSASQENQIKRKILMGMRVVCCTLNSCGSSQLMNHLGPQGGETSCFFDCAIIDEAAQCIEADTLIPLQYGIRKIVLVGDPEQLPPTVISKEAKDMNYGQSLFERYYSHFKMQTDNPILMLTTQYRMHRDVCSFPNNHVYMGRLHTDRDVDKERSRHYPLKHYAVFDVGYGQEYQEDNGALCNGAEASFVARLCNFLMRKHKLLRPERIGVVTPYQKQKKVILDDLRRTKNNSAIEVGTVDGFQGREKDVIVMSCVRACSASGGIGFMKDRRRMNVALTRAKYACYVVGHMHTLKSDRNWSSLMDDAKRRKVLVTTQKPSEDNRAFDWLRK